MSGYLTILKMQLKSRYGISALKHEFNQDRKSFYKKAGLAFFILLSLLTLVGMYCFVVYKATFMFREYGQQDIILAIAFLISMIMILFFGFYMVLGTLFFSKDSEFLATLPIKQSTVFLSKFSLVYLSELSISFLLIAPVVIMYGVMMSMPVVFYLKAIIVWMFVPAIPLLIASLLSSIFMGFIAKTRHRNLISIIGGMSGVILMVGLQVAFNMMVRTEDSAGVLALVQPGGVVNSIGAAFPPSSWAANALALSGSTSIGYLLSYLCTSIAMLIIVVLVANFIYYRGSLSQLETLKKTKIINKSDYVKGVRSQKMAVFIREWKMILRSPSYAINSLASLIVAPIVIIIPLVGGGASSVELDLMVKMLGGVDQILVCLVLAALMTFLGSINPAVATSISREGKGVWQNQVIPMDYKEILKAKFFVGISIGVGSALLAAVASYIGFGLNILVVVAAFAISAILIAAATALALRIDVKKPKLNWNTETEAIKQNMNSLISMLYAMLMIGFLGVLVYFLYGLIDPVLVVALIVLIAIGAFFMTYSSLMRSSNALIYEE